MSTAMGSFDASTLKAFTASALKARGATATDAYMAFDPARPSFERWDNPYNTAIKAYDINTSYNAFGTTGESFAAGKLRDIFRSSTTLYRRRTALGPASALTIPSSVLTTVTARLFIKDFRNISESFTSLKIYLTARNAAGGPYQHSDLTELVGTIPTASISAGAIVSTSLDVSVFNTHNGETFDLLLTTEKESTNAGLDDLTSGVSLNPTNTVAPTTLGTRVGDIKFE